MKNNVFKKFLCSLCVGVLCTCVGTFANAQGRSCKIQVRLLDIIELDTLEEFLDNSGAEWYIIDKTGRRGKMPIVLLDDGGLSGTTYPNAMRCLDVFYDDTDPNCPDFLKTVTPGTEDFVVSAFYDWVDSDGCYRTFRWGWPAILNRVVRISDDSFMPLGKVRSRNMHL